jgi:hypothetical protein
MSEAISPVFAILCRVRQNDKFHRRRHGILPQVGGEALKTIGLFLLFACQIAAASEPQWWTNQKRACGLSPSLAYETWRQQGFPCPGGAPPVNDQERQRQQQLELERQRELQRQRDEAEHKQKADDADRKGLEAANRGDWKGAANWFIAALEFTPKSTEIRAHVDRAKTALADAGSAAEILALRQRIEDSIAAANIEALRQNLEDDATARRLAVMAGDFRSQTKPKHEPIISRSERGPQVLYPVLVRPVSPNSPPAKVLAQYQSKIKEVDEEIHRAQEALRHLIESNTQSEEERLEWTKESQEATIDAQNLGVKLVIDLIGAHVDHLAETSGQERANVLNHLLNRAEEGGPRNSIHAAYGMLLNRKDELERIHKEVRLAGKENDLRIKIGEFSVNKHTKFTGEDFWDIVSQLKKVEELAGPSKDLLDAAYTIYRQAASFDNLALIQGNQEKALQAAAGLRRYIVKLEAQKKVAKARASVKAP